MAYVNIESQSTEVLRLYTDGVGTTKIAKQFGCHVASVHRLLARHGVLPHNIAKGIGRKICAHERCSGWFETPYADKKYCSARCQRLSKIRRNYVNNPDRQKNNALRSKFGISLEEKRALFLLQGERCANPGCRSDTSGNSRDWHVDHDHVTGKIRGILCCHCNRSLGGARDSVRVLGGLIDYLNNREPKGFTWEDAAAGRTPDYPAILKA